MNIDSVENGIVLDHITSGKAMEIYRYLKLSELDCPVAMIMGVKSKKLGKKDIVKIEKKMDLDLDVLGYIDPGITVNIIRDGHIEEKCKLALPERLVNVLKCKNPRCITTAEPELDQIFKLVDYGNQVYGCAYCESRA